MDSRILYLMSQRDVENFFAGLPAAMVQEALSSLIRCEVWRGLPPYGFEVAANWTGRPALRVDKDNVYAWVPPETTAALRMNQNCLLFALGIRRSGHLNVFWVGATKPNVTEIEAIHKAREFNASKVRLFVRHRLATA